MKLSTLKNKKSLKIAILLLTSLLIASVSASTYYTMFMTGNITIGGNEVTFTPGGDWGTSTMGTGNQTVSLNLAGEEGAVTTISDPVRILNSGTGSHDVNLQLVTWDGDSEDDLNYIHITIYNDASGGTAQNATIQLVPNSSDPTETGWITIGASQTFRVEWVIYWQAGATTSGVTVSLKLDVR
jgi:hypothetical protein